MIEMADNQNECITISSIAEKLGISKIYLEQVFSLLKRAKLVTSLKGAQGGYQLSKIPEKITALEIMKATEVGLFEKTENSVSEKISEIDTALHEMIWDKLDSSLVKLLEQITLADLYNKYQDEKSNGSLMFYI